MEQLSIGIRFCDESGMVREEFLGYTELCNMDAKTIACAIEHFLKEIDLNPAKCVGQGYDGCSTMAGKDNGVQKLLRTLYPNAIFSTVQVIE